MIKIVGIVSSWGGIWCWLIVYNVDWKEASG